MVLHWHKPEKNERIFTNKHPFATPGHPFSLDPVLIPAV